MYSAATYTVYGEKRVLAKLRKSALIVLVMYSTMLDVPHISCGGGGYLTTLPRPAISEDMVVMI